MTWRWRQKYPGCDGFVCCSACNFPTFLHLLPLCWVWCTRWIRRRRKKENRPFFYLLLKDPDSGISSWSQNCLSLLAAAVKNVGVFSFFPSNSTAFYSLYRNILVFFPSSYSWIWNKNAVQDVLNSQNSRRLFGSVCSIQLIRSLPLVICRAAWETAAPQA